MVTGCGVSRSVERTDKRRGMRGNEDERMLSLLTADAAAQGGGMIMIVLSGAHCRFFLFLPDEASEEGAEEGTGHDLSS